MPGRYKDAPALMAAMALLLLLAGAGAAATSAPPELARLPKPHDVASATSLHASALAAARRTASRHGHELPAVGLDAAPQGSAGSLIVPSDYGADPTGRTDSTPAFMQMLAQLVPGPVPPCTPSPS